MSSEATRIHIYPIRADGTRIQIYPIPDGDIDRIRVVDMRSWEREGTIWWEGTSHEIASIVAQAIATDLMASGILDFVPIDTGPDCPF